MRTIKKSKKLFQSGKNVVSKDIEVLHVNDHNFFVKINEEYIPFKSSISNVNEMEIDYLLKLLNIDYVKDDTLTVICLQKMKNKIEDLVKKLTFMMSDMMDFDIFSFVYIEKNDDDLTNSDSLYYDSINKFFTEFVIKYVKDAYHDAFMCLGYFHFLVFMKLFFEIKLINEELSYYYSYKEKFNTAINKLNKLYEEWV